MTDWAVLGSIVILTTAGFIHGLFGIGFAMIATPLLALFLDYRAAVLLAAVPLLLMAVSWLLVNHRQLRSCGLPSTMFLAICIGAVAGAVLQARLPERVSLLLLASILAASALTSWSSERERTFRIRFSTPATVAFGALAGLTESALHVGAPFMVLYGALAQLDRRKQLVALNVCFALGKTIQLGLMRVTGLPQISLLAVATGTTASMLAFYLGNAVANRFSETHFRKVLRYFLVAVAGVLILRNLFL